MGQPSRATEKGPWARVGRSLAQMAAEYILPFALLLTPVSFSGVAQANGSFPIQASEHWTCENTSNRHCIYWLDDERVIFSGTRPLDFERKDGRRIWKYAIYIWDLKANRVTKYADASPRHFCYSDGYIRYVRMEQQKAAVVAGVFGKEVETGDEAVKVPEQTGWDTNLSCGTYRPRTPHPLPGYKVALRKHDGFLYFGVSTTGKEPITYYPEGVANGHELPIARWQVSPVTVTVSTVDPSYLLYGAYRSNERAGVNSCPNAPVVRTIYRLASDGSVSEIRLPPDERFRCYVERFALVHSGVLVFKGGSHIDAARLYLLQKGNIREVTRGAITHHRVSPNGCRVAVAISSTGDPQMPSAPSYRGHLKVIEFCTKKAP